MGGFLSAITPDFIEEPINDARKAVQGIADDIGLGDAFYVADTIANAPDILTDGETWSQVGDALGDAGEYIWDGVKWVYNGVKDALGDINPLGKEAPLPPVEPYTPYGGGGGPGGAPIDWGAAKAEAQTYGALGGQMRDYGQGITNQGLSGMPSGIPQTIGETSGYAPSGYDYGIEFADPSRGSINTYQPPPYAPPSAPSQPTPTQPVPYQPPPYTGPSTLNHIPYSPPTTPYTGPNTFSRYLPAQTQAMSGPVQRPPSKGIGPAINPSFGAGVNSNSRNAPPQQNAGGRVANPNLVPAEMSQPGEVKTTPGVGYDPRGAMSVDRSPEAIKRALTQPPQNAPGRPMDPRISQILGNRPAANTRGGEMSGIKNSMANYSGGQPGTGGSPQTPGAPAGPKPLTQQEVMFLQGQDDRKGQKQTIGDLRNFYNQAEGPSAAQAQLQMGSDMAMRQQLALARSGRGGGVSTDSLRGALGANVDTMQRTNQESAVLRAQETNDFQNRRLSAMGTAGNLGQGLYNTESSLYGQVRGQDADYAMGRYKADIDKSLGLGNLGQSYAALGGQYTGYEQQTNSEARQGQVDDRQFGADEARYARDDYWKQRQDSYQQQEFQHQQDVDQFNMYTGGLSAVGKLYSGS